MHILFINQFFPPDSAPTGRLLADLCREMVAHGHQVSVVCGRAVYSSDSAPPVSSVAVHRVPNADYSRRPVQRLWSWVSFLGLATAAAIELPQAEIVVTMTTPPALSFAGWLHSLLWRSRFWCWEMDLYPDVAVGSGALRPGSRLERLLAWMLDLPRRNAHRIVVLGHCMRGRLAGHGLDSSKIHVVENWVDGSHFPESPLPPGPPFRILYSGNFGAAHEAATVVQVLEELRDDPRFRFLFCGGGSGYAALQEQCARLGLTNAEFFPPADAADFAARLHECHIGLVTLRTECLGTVVPSKLYALLASGRPCLFIGPAASTPGRHIREHGCGWQFEAGDAAGVVRQLRILAGETERVGDAGRNARTVFEQGFDRARSVAHFRRLLVEQSREP